MYDPSLQLLSISEELQEKIFPHNIIEKGIFVVNDSVFSRLIIILSVAAILVAAGGGIGWTIYRIVDIGFQTVLLGIQYVVLLLVSALIIVVFVSLLIRSCYKITDKEIVLWFGIIKSSYKIAEIESVHLFTKTNKLVVYFKNERYTVIVVKPEWNNEFIKDLLSKNEKIRYDVSTTDKDGDDFVE